MAKPIIFALHSKYQSYLSSKSNLKLQLAHHYALSVELPHKNLMMPISNIVVTSVDVFSGNKLILRRRTKLAPLHLG